MRVAVLGGTGFIGHHVTRSLVEAGEDVTTIHRGYTPVRVPGVRSVTADRQSSATLASALTAAAPHVLIDMAAYTGEDMERLLTAVPASLERLLVISSGDVYWTYAAFLGLSSALAPAAAVHEGAPLREQLYPYRAQAKGPEDLLYSYEKIVVERTARTGAGVPVTILRLPMVYGPEDPQKRVGGYLERLGTSASGTSSNDRVSSHDERSVLWWTAAVGVTNSTSQWMPLPPRYSSFPPRSKTHDFKRKYISRDQYSGCWSRITTR